MTDDPKPSDTPTPPTSAADAAMAGRPEAAADKPAGTTPAEPLKGEVSRTDAPGAGASAAPVAPPAAAPAPKPANPAAAQTATTSETSSATGQPTAPAIPPGASASQAAASATGAATVPKA